CIALVRLSNRDRGLVLHCVRVGFLISLLAGVRDQILFPRFPYKRRPPRLVRATHARRTPGVLSLCISPISACPKTSSVPFPNKVTTSPPLSRRKPFPLYLKAMT